VSASWGSFMMEMGEEEEVEEGVSKVRVEQATNLVASSGTSSTFLHACDIKIKHRPEYIGRYLKDIEIHLVTAI
jgi:hypothetical protein